MQKYKFVILFCFSALLASCTPSESDIQNAIAQTQTANPTVQNTATLVPTSVPTSTQTPTPEPTVTPVPTVTATPPDVGSTMTNLVDEATLMYVPAGRFIMGSENGASNESPVHTVRLDAFWIYQTVVTNAMFEKFVEATGYQTAAEKNGYSKIYRSGSWDSVQGTDWQHPIGPDSDLSDLLNHPVVHVSWYDAQTYCEWAGGGLPTEAQWEKAARGIQGRIYPWGDWSVAGNLANFADSNTSFNWSDKNSNDGYSKTAPVGSYLDGASPYGLLDMAGNVYEWVADWFNSVYYQNSPLENPTGPLNGDSRVMRGGSWSGNLFSVRSAFRSVYAPPFQSFEFVGFRCAISSPTFEGNAITDNSAEQDGGIILAEFKGLDMLGLEAHEGAINQMIANLLDNDPLDSCPIIHEVEAVSGRINPTYLVYISAAPEDFFLVVIHTINSDSEPYGSALFGTILEGESGNVIVAAEYPVPEGQTAPGEFEIQVVAPGCKIFTEIVSYGDPSIP